MLSASQAYQISIDTHNSLLSRLESIITDAARRGLTTVTTTIPLTEDARILLTQLGFTVRYSDTGVVSFYSISWN